jgi:hypothetical protein
VATFYVRFDDANDGFMMCVEESLGFCFAAAQHSPTT